MCDCQNSPNENIHKLALNGNCWESGCSCLLFVGSDNLCENCHHSYYMHSGWRNGIPSEHDDDDYDF